MEQGFRRLTAWQKADDLACEAWAAVSTLPRELGWLRSQISRAAVSVPADIAEGYSRGSLKDYLRFLDIARGSLGELEYYLHFLRRNRIMEERSLAKMEAPRIEAGRLLFALTESLRKKLREDADWRRGMREDAEVYVAATEE